MKFLLSPRLCFALAFFCSFNLVSQTKNGAYFLKIAKSHTSTFSYDSAIHYYKLAKEQFLLEGDSSQFYVTDISISLEQSKLGKFEEALETLQGPSVEGKSFLGALDISRLYRGMAHIKNLSGQPMKEVIPIYEKALNSIDTVESQEAGRIKAVINSDIGILNFNYGRYDAAERQWKKSLSILNTLKTEDFAQTICEVTMNTAAVLKVRGAFSESIELYERAADIALKHIANPEGILAFVYDGISSVLIESTSFSQHRVVDYYTKAIELMRKQGENHNPVHSLLNLGKIYLKQGRKEEGFELISEALYLSRKYLGEQNEKTAWAYFNMGEYYHEAGQLVQARQSFLKVIKIQQDRNREQSTLSARVYIRLASISSEEKNRRELFQYINGSLESVGANVSLNPSAQNMLAAVALVLLSSDELDSALLYFQKTLIANHLDFESLDYGLNPKDLKYSSQTLAFATLERKAFTLEKKFDLTGDIQYLEKAYETILTGRNLISETKQGIGSLQDKFNTLAQLSLWTKTGVRISEKLFNRSGEMKYIHSAFELSEANKANLILTSLRENIAIDQSDVPIELLKKNEDIANGISFYEQQLYIAEQYRDSAFMDRSKSLLFDFRRQGDSMRTLFKTQYPSFYKASYQYDLSGVEDVQKQLEENELLLDYHYGDSSIYIFSLSKSDIELSKFPLDSNFTKQITEYSQMISNPNQSQAALDQFLAINKQIRNKLLPSDTILSSYEKLTLVTDKYLSAIPFESLVIGEEKVVNSFSNLQYLIKSHDISYANSLTLLARLNTEKDSKKSNKILAFAPIFDQESITELIETDSSRSGLNALVWTKEEVANISKHFETEQLIGKQATELKFRQDGYNYPIIHIASHGLLNTEEPLFSKLVFSPFDTDSINDGYLNTQELFTMKIPAEMVVLSACNSGSGDLISGEGVISLANGFFYAGSKSLIMSLWTANDQSTATIIDSFYEELSQGKPKSQALRNAKLKFLNQADGLQSHPYYWAHMVVNGNNSPIVKKNTLWIYLTSALILIVLITVTRRVRQRQTVPGS